MVENISPQPGALLKWNALARREPRQWLIERILPYPAVIGLSAHPKTGKSFIALGMSAHVAAGIPYRGRNVHQGAVVYIMAEGGEGAADRMEALRLDMFGGNDVDLPLFVSMSSVDLIHDCDGFIQLIRQELVDQVPVAIVVDTLNATLFGSENSDEDMSGYMRSLHAIKAAFGCSVLVIHHLAKKESSGARGHGALLGGLDALLVLKETSAQTLTLSVAMMRDGPKGEILTSRLKPVVIGQDEDGDDITSCVVVDTNPAGSSNLIGKKRASEALTCLEKLIEEQGGRPKKLRLPKTVKAVPMKSWAIACKDKKIGESATTSKETAKKARGRARAALIKRRVVVEVGDYVYLADDAEQVV